MPISDASFDKTALTALEARLVQLVNEAVTQALAQQVPKLFNKQDAAAYLDISLRNLEGLMKRRRITYSKAGAGRAGGVRFRRQDLDAYIESHLVPAHGRVLLSVWPKTPVF